jgi:DNA polymerase I
MTPPVTSDTGSSREGDRSGALFLLDGSNIAYRAYFALPPEIATSAGFPTNALYGFCLMTIKVLADYAPGVVIVCWDSREKTFRHGEFEEYKAQRKPMPEPLSEQWPYFQELAAAFGFVNLTLPGYEADDLLGTLARQADGVGRDAVIVTGDRDAMQLASEHVRIMATARGVTDVKIYDPPAVEARFGVPPRLIPDLIGLKGDTSDNIPGVPGIGEKTAAQLLAQFGTLESVLDHIDEVSGVKRRELLREHREAALMSKRLALLDCDAPIDILAAELTPHQPDPAKLRELFLRFEFSSLANRVNEIVPDVAKPAAAPPADRMVAEEAIAASQVERALDLTLPVGLSAAGEEGGGFWLAQAAEGAEPALFRVEASGLSRGPLRELLRHAHSVCHDFKSVRGLHSLLDRPGHDTFLAAYLLAPGKRDYPLAHLVEEEGLPKTCCQRDATGLAADAVAVLGVAAAQEHLLRRQGQWGLLQEIELPLTRVLIEMEEVGIHLDCYRLGEITVKLQDRMEEMESRIYELAGGEFNLGSPSQLGQVLFEKLGLPRGRKIKTGYSTDSKTLEGLRASHPIVECIETHRELSKLLSTYLLALPAAVDPSTGRLHTTFHQAVTTTGRLSSSDPNLQNVPIRTELGAQIRECFTAEPGNLLVVADYSQIELRITAYLAQEESLLLAFRQGEDVHAHTAAEVFGVDESEVTGTHRRHAKAVNFGIMYGISAFGLSQQLGIDRDEAAAYIDRYFERMPRVRAFIDATIADARTQGFVATIFGRRRAIPELVSGNFQARSLGERLAVNSVIQGSAADIIKVAMIRCHRRLGAEFPSAKLVMQVHDELVFETPADQAEAVKKMVVEEMIAAFDMDPALAVDAGVGPDWYSAK